MPTTKNIERQMVSVGDPISQKNSASSFTWASPFVAAAESNFGSNQILIQPSFVKLETSQFDQVVLVDTVVDNFADVLLDKNDSEPMASNANCCYILLYLSVNDSKSSKVFIQCYVCYENTIFIGDFF